MKKAKAVKSVARRRGRPAAGIGSNGEPEKVSEYRRMTVLLPPHVKNKLEAVATLQHSPAWRIIVAAIDSYIAALPVEDRKAVEALAQRMGKGEASAKLP